MPTLQELPVCGCGAIQRAYMETAVNALSGSAIGVTLVDAQSQLDEAEGRIRTRRERSERRQTTPTTNGDGQGRFPR